jgi:hypothetical protein
MYYGHPGAGDPQGAGLADPGDVFAPPVDASAGAAWYAESSGGTTLADSSGNGNNGALNNGVLWQTGRHGSGIHLDGLDDYVTVPHHPTLSPASLTVEAWIRLNGQTGEQHIVDQRDTGGGYNLRVDGTAFPLRLRWIVRDANGTDHYVNAPGVLDSATWYHVAGTWDGTTQRLYVNGVLGPSSVPTVTGGIAGSVTDLVLGGVASAPTTSNFSGDLDGVRISAVARGAFPYALVPPQDPTSTQGSEKVRPAPCPW